LKNKQYLYNLKLLKRSAMQQQLGRSPMHNSSGGSQQLNGMQGGGAQSNGNLMNQAPYSSSSRFNQQQQQQQSSLGLLRSPSNQLASSQSNSRNQFQQPQSMNNDV
jgi:hypothetical protein